ncbi:hypothetical protein H257_00149 [Aphanomyces astaci]|uniref:WRKY19-like zinc finger domain-containing protein n=1 Tax=Aphanomyces astaci TaxID=112090 RepID=W4HBG9_APHAT|nr:hypothetical protein H257_00149 [Aphanomyces astaci]ETV88599.1 hypothetical protein H257_00149 [Aphanomyces astaci]|eukprot:XP_009820999.1 hypothetical protein H257_00149 [Aphanomyces astaci]
MQQQQDGPYLLPSIAGGHGVALCAHTNCRRFAKIHGVCILHSRVIVRPTSPPQSHSNRSRMLPNAHEKRRNHNRRCRIEQCRSYARGGGYCTRHGGGRKCSVPGCTTSSQTGGYCRQHGGGSKCREPTCRQFARVGGRCLIHRDSHEDESSSVGEVQL